MVVDHIPSPAENAESKVRDIYTGDLDTEVANAMMKCDADGPLMIHITKLYNNVEATGFDAFGRVMSGTIKRGQVVRVLGEGYSVDDEEDMAMQQVSDVWINESRLVEIHKRFYHDFLTDQNLSLDTELMLMACQLEVGSCLVVLTIQLSKRLLSHNKNGMRMLTSSDLCASQPLPS